MTSSRYHMGKAMSSLSETLQWRKNQNINTILDEDFSGLEESGKAQFFGRSRGGHPVLVLVNGRHVTPRTAPAREKEVRYAVYLLEKARAEGQTRRGVRSHHCNQCSIRYDHLQSTGTNITKTLPGSSCKDDYIPKQHVILDDLENSKISTRSCNGSK
ncbi:hypothetical protein HDU76_012292, partial [Blyttiomyces sp. JEL0837]